MQFARVPTFAHTALPARRAGFLALPAILALFISGCASPGRTDALPDSLHDTLEVLAARHHVCSVAVAVIRNRKLDSIDSATGCQAARRPEPDSVFQAASLSKPLFAYAVLKLAAQGKMALDAPVVSFLPQGYLHRFHPLKAAPVETVTDPRLAKITVRMVLNHTSGLPNWASGRLHFDAEPGARWNYSGEGYVLLQRAVEAVTGQPLDQFMAAQVFGPLDMRDTSYVWNERIAQRLLAGSKANGAPRTAMVLDTPIAAFSLYTTVVDYGKFLEAVLRDGDVVQAITAAPVTVDPDLDLAWGLGWGIERGEDDSYMWQWGNNTGYRAFVIASLRTGDGLVMLTNGENGLKLAEPVTRKVLPAEHKLFRFGALGDDILSTLCNTVRVCL